RNWGFTVYRTSYEPSTEEQWQRFLEKVQTHAYKQTLEVADASENDPYFLQIWSLFRIDARSHPALAGLGLDELRRLYNSGDGGPPVNADLRSHRVFLVADDDVLSDVDTFTVKCVEADYEASNHIPRNARLGRQRYFGWMPMKAGYIVQLWKELETFPFETIAPQTIGESHLVIWEP
ncbi:hypothetical protein IQ06DRAFT_199246, partial [Phaeosphaeriaceae sp. SRC1lsM3a]